MEFPEIRDRIYKYSDRVLLPTLKPHEIKEKYGIPCFSKEQDFYIYYYQNALRKKKVPAKTIQQKIDGTYDKGFSGISKKAREYVLSGNAHKITHLCCYYLKKKPFHDYEKETGKKPILGVRGEESSLRKTQYKSCFTSSSLTALDGALITTAIKEVPFLVAVPDKLNKACEVEPVLRPVAPS